MSHFLDFPIGNHPRSTAQLIWRLIGGINAPDPDQESVLLLLYQYGFKDLHGPAKKIAENLMSGKSNLSRHLVENEDYRPLSPQLRDADYDVTKQHDEQTSGSVNRPDHSSSASEYPTAGMPTEFGPKGFAEESTERKRQRQPNTDFQEPQGPPRSCGPERKVDDPSTDDPMGQPHEYIKTSK